MTYAVRAGGKVLGEKPKSNLSEELWLRKKEKQKAKQNKNQRLSAGFEHRAGLQLRKWTTVGLEISFCQDLGW